MRKNEAKDLLELYIKFLKRNVPNYSQIMSKEIKSEKWSGCTLSCCNDDYKIQLYIQRLKDDQNE